MNPRNVLLWNADPDFSALPLYEIEGRGLCVSVAPAEQQSWGAEGFLFQAEDEPLRSKSLDWYSFHNREEGVYLFGREQTGRWGLVRYIQGDVWGGTQCDTPIAWHIPKPIPADSIHSVSFDYSLDTANLLTLSNSWLMFAINIWLDGDTMPKPLVIDLVLHHQCNNAVDCRIRHFEDDAAFHYMTPIDLSEPIDLKKIITDATSQLYLDECSELTCVGRLPENAILQMEQFEFVIEVLNAEGAAFLRNLSLYYVETQ